MLGAKLWSFWPVWLKIRSVGAGLDFIFTYQEKYLLGSRESMEEFITLMSHGSSSKSRWPAENPAKLASAMRRWLHCVQKLPYHVWTCIDSKYLCYLGDPPRGDFLSGWKLPCQLKHAHAFLCKWAVAEISLHLIHFCWGFKIIAGFRRLSKVLLISLPGQTCDFHL